MKALTLLLAGATLILTTAARAQVTSRTSLALNAGLSASTDRVGGIYSVGVAHPIGRYRNLRLEYHEQYLSAGAQPLGVPGGGAGSASYHVRALVASLEIYFQADRAGPYLLAGAGPHSVGPDLGRNIDFGVHAGAGLLLRLDRAAIVLEARYIRFAGSLGPAFTVPVTLGLRL